ncbi:hypothetical protein LWI29_004921 [Acer saccharum]|uniref:RING-type E3 ubiquitin transferase n=1 Tax=Acer saccharum TaxID=4024 RepID=A0AA39VI85_ACESA|nr:hypothetical protein LWI29_004921 [Acer saccharum]
MEEEEKEGKRRRRDVVEEKKIRTKYATSGIEEHGPINLLDSKVVRKIQERKALFDKYEAKEAVQRERKNLQKILDNYILICHQIGFMQKDCTLRWMILARGLWSSCRDTLSRSLLWERQQTSTIQRVWIISSPRKPCMCTPMRLFHVKLGLSAEDTSYTYGHCICKQVQSLKVEDRTQEGSSDKFKREALEEMVRHVKAENSEAIWKAAEVSSSLYMHQSFPMFSLSEIHEATRYFDPSLKVTEQEYGSIYKGLLHHTPVTIKVLNLDSLQGPSEFQQEVNVMNQFRHPNVITVIGVCQESCALIYEYLPNGSLEDRLNCKDNTPPLSWKTRICIATDICSVLIFLHSSNPQSIIHGDLKAANVLLDSNFVCKLSDFGIYHYRQFPLKEEVSSKSDIYSFGIILLQLLTGRSWFDKKILFTGRSSLNIAEEMQDGGNLEAFLDYTAGDWPFVEAIQLVHMALRCCDIEPSKRPDLVSEAWRVLKPMRAACGASSSFWTGSRDHSKPPSYFICPILLEVMQDPVVAADGYTYEAEAMKGWLESGHDTSPMTNLRLPHHQVIPNHSLRSAIQEWLDILT